MFPLTDSTPRKGFPFVNYLLIGLTISVFFLQISVSDFETFVYQFAFIPIRFDVLNPETYRYILYSLFLHGGIFHLLSNMWFLHIFGDNVEDRLGHLPYLFFYLIGGAIATLAQYFFATTSQIPMLGASGAVSAIAGAYFVLFRHSRIRTLVVYFLIIDIIELPVWFFLGYWFFLLVFSVVGSLVNFDIQRGGIAWFAHIGGFVYGYLIAKGLRERAYS